MVGVGSAVFLLTIWLQIRYIYMETIELDKEHWTFQSKNGSVRGIARVPGNIYTDLFNNKIIDDPLYGSNDQSLKWVAVTDWIYQCNFIIPHRWTKVRHLLFQFCLIFNIFISY